MYNLTSTYNLDVPHTRISGLWIVRILLEIHAEAIPAFKGLRFSACFFRHFASLRFRAAEAPRQEAEWEFQLALDTGAMTPPAQKL